MQQAQRPGRLPLRRPLQLCARCVGTVAVRRPQIATLPAGLTHYLVSPEPQRSNSRSVTLGGCVVRATEMKPGVLPAIGGSSSVEGAGGGGGMGGPGGNFPMLGPNGQPFNFKTKVFKPPTTYTLHTHKWISCCIREGCLQLRNGVGIAYAGPCRIRRRQTVRPLNSIAYDSLWLCNADAANVEPARSPC